MLIQYVFMIIYLYMNNYIHIHLEVLFFKL